jgi:hypothetical protein
MKRSIDDPAEATDDVAGATDDPTNTSIAKPKRRKRKRKASSEKHQVVFLVSEDWNNQTQTMQDSGLIVANLVGGTYTKQEAPNIKRLVELYFGWSHDKIREIAQGAPADDLILLPGLPGQPGYEPSQVKSETIDCS